MDLSQFEQMVVFVFTNVNKDKYTFLLILSHISFHINRTA